MHIETAIVLAEIAHAFRLLHETDIEHVESLGEDQKKSARFLSKMFPHSIEGSEEERALLFHRIRGLYPTFSAQNILSAALELHAVIVVELAQTIDEGDGNVRCCLNYVLDIGKPIAESLLHNIQKGGYAV